MPQENKKSYSENDTAQIKNAVSGNNPQPSESQVGNPYPSQQTQQTQQTQNPYSPTNSSTPQSNEYQSSYQNPSLPSPPPVPSPNYYSQPGSGSMTQELSDSQSEMPGMSPSLMSSDAPSPNQENQQEYSQYDNNSSLSSFQSNPYQSLDSYGSEYQPYSSSVSPETMTDIAESIVLEKLSPMKNKIEKVLDSKTEFESKLSSIDDRLKRIEKIIDKLQLSILERVGQYVTDVSDLKKELIETQKSFSSTHKSHSHKSHSHKKK